MPDWSDLVRQKLGPLGLGPQRVQEIVAELANHLEDFYEGLRHDGLSDEEAIARVMARVQITSELARQVEQAECEEGEMNQRTKTVWLPGMLALALSAGLMWVIIRVGVEPRIIWRTPDQAFLVLYIPWFAVLPVVGGVGAYFCMRFGGKVRQRLLAGAFPALAMLGLLMAVLPVGIVVETVTRSRVPLSVMLYGFAAGVVNYVLLPGGFLLLGVTPFLNLRGNGPSERRA